MGEPYPVALVPLLSQFLGRRRAKADFPLRAMEKLGLDRPSYFFAMDLGTQDPRGALPKDVGTARNRRTERRPLRPLRPAKRSGCSCGQDARGSLPAPGRPASTECRR